MTTKINVLVPMAGLGSRFAEKGYALPKPLIKIFGKPMIQLVVESLNLDNANYIFIVQKEHRVKYHLDDVLDGIAPGCTIVEVDGLTDGAARTTLMAKHLINNDVPLVVSNSDQVVVWDSSVFRALAFSQGVIATFTADDPKWSYAEIENGIVKRVAEKEVISNNASVGIYSFKTGADYVKYAEQMIAKDIRTNNEFYIAPVYNEAIEDGQLVVAYEVEEMHGLGTPEDMNNYINEVIND